jgi:hypothetical protein
MSRPFRLLPAIVHATDALVRVAAKCGAEGALVNADDRLPALHPTPRLRVQATRRFSEAKGIVGRSHGHDHGAD